MSHDMTCGCPECEQKAEANYFAQMDDEEGSEDEATCPQCEGDGGDKWNDYALPCPTCGGDGRLW